MNTPHKIIEVSDDPNIAYDQIRKIREIPDLQYPFSIDCNSTLIPVREPAHLDYVLIGMNLVIESSRYKGN